MEPRNLSEEDLRSHVVNAYLRDHGFSASQLQLEHSFKIRIGHNTHTIRPQRSVRYPRADVLVRNSDGRNLLVIESKSPQESLTDEDRDQGISYARLLAEGGIAPFVVVTNGECTNIFDTITRTKVNGDRVPLDHPHAINGFRVATDDLAIRSEALQIFVGLSAQNLLEFCRIQVAHRMGVLRSEDPLSGRKYVPSLYVERAEAAKDLSRLLAGGAKVVLIVAPPQVGKTNFLCRSSEEMLAEQRPCLFYPAIGMADGLLVEMMTDFEWDIREAGSARDAIYKINRIVGSAGQKLVLFVDGLNESAQHLIRAIDRDCERLAMDHIQLVVSMTSVAASRVLRDDAGNVSYLASAAGVPSGGIELLESAPSRRDRMWSVVSLADYGEEEQNSAYEAYKRVYGVAEPRDHVRTADPFLLRIGMEYYRKGTLPPVFEESMLLDAGIRQKVLRSGLTFDLAYRYLRELGIAAYECGLPIRYEDALARWGLPMVADLPKGLFEAAMLARVTDDAGRPALDFYYGREREFVISVWALGWDENPQFELEKEFLACRSRPAALDALRWLCRQPPTLERTLARPLRSYADADLRRYLLEGCAFAFRRPVRRHSKDQNLPPYAASALKEGLEDPDMRVRAEAAKLIALTGGDDEDLAAAIVINEVFIRHLLEVESVYPLASASLGSVVLHAFEELQQQEGSEESELTDVLVRIWEGEGDESLVAGAAAKALAFVAPRIFLSQLRRLGAPGRQLSLPLLGPENAVQMSSLSRHSCEKALELAAAQLSGLYFGDICPGCLSTLEDQPDALASEYADMKAICEPAISEYAGSPGAQELEHLLDSLKSAQQRADAAN